MLREDVKLLDLLVTHTSILLMVMDELTIGRFLSDSL